MRSVKSPYATDRAVYNYAHDFYLNHSQHVENMVHCHFKQVNDIVSEQPIGQDLYNPELWKASQWNWFFQSFNYNKNRSVAVKTGDESKSRADYHIIILKKMLRPFTKRNEREEQLMDLQLKFGELSDLMFSQGKFMDRAGVADEGYNSADVQANWNKFHQICKEFYDIARRK